MSFHTISAMSICDSVTERHALSAIERLAKRQRLIDATTVHIGAKLPYRGSVSKLACSIIAIQGPDS